MSVHEPMRGGEQETFGRRAERVVHPPVVAAGSGVPHLEGPDPVGDVVREIVGAQVPVVHDLGGDALAVHLREAYVDVVDAA